MFDAAEGEAGSGEERNLEGTRASGLLWHPHTYL